MRMKCCLAAVAALGSLLLMNVQAEPQYVNGVEGIKAATLPPPGVYGRLYGVFYTADTLKDSDGDKIENDFSLKVYAAVPRLIWVSPVEILGGNYFADIIVPVLKTDVSLKTPVGDLDENKTGLGDICVEPFGLSWHGKQFDAATAVGGYAPTGEFDQDNPASPGHGMWSAMFTGGGTYYFDQAKTWTASLLARYEVHGEKKDVDYTPGNDFHFEWGVAKTINQTIDAGLTGYCYWQTTKDSDTDISDEKARVYAMGPEINVFIPKHILFISLRGEWEFQAKDNTEGAIGVLTLTKGF